MSAAILAGTHVASMVLFLLILVDSLWKKFLQRGVKCFLPRKRLLKINREKLIELRRIYQSHEDDLKTKASLVVEARLAQGKDSCTDSLKNN